MDEKAKAATFGLIEQLKRHHLDESEDQRLKRYQKRLAVDPDLLQEAMRGAFELLNNEMFDKLVREGKEVAPELRKPH
ncbi:MAG: hypothetical protein P4M05_17535 [Bradyrhizobium sp.]|nr:hypothetical protein [Bradyrhizobium sp.]